MKSEITLEESYSSFLNYLKDSGKALATILAYSSDLKQLLDFLDKLSKTNVSQVELSDLQFFKQKLEADNYVAKTISRKINAIRTFFKFLVLKKIIVTNPSINLTHPRLKHSPPRVLSKIEYRALRDATRNDIRANTIVEIFLQTGIRIGELTKIQVFDIKNNSLNIRNFESHESRTIPLNQAVVLAIEKYLKIRPRSKSKNLFLTKTGRPFLVRNIRSTIERYFRIAGIKGAKVNDLRHTFIAHQLKAGTPLLLVSKLAGHKRISTTEKYLKYFKKESKIKGKLLEL